MVRDLVTTSTTRVGWAVSIALLMACLPAFAPGIRAQDHHADLSGASEDGACMSCHTSESEALAAGSGFQADSPLVADWMLEDPRNCVSCHGVREPRRGQRTSAGAEPRVHPPAPEQGSER